MADIWDAFRTGQAAAIAPQAALLHNAGQAATLMEHLRRTKHEEEIRGLLASDMPEEQKTAQLMKLPGGLEFVDKLGQIQLRQQQLQEWPMIQKLMSGTQSPQVLSAPPPGEPAGPT